MRTRTAALPPARPLRVAGGAAVALVFFLEGGCASGGAAPASSDAGARPAAEAPPSSPFKEGSSAPLPSAPQLEAYEAARIKAWDPSRRFKALFRAEVSPKVGAIGRGYLSVWWDGKNGALTWRASAPIAGAGRGGILRVKEGSGDLAARESAALLSARLSAPDLIACVLGTPDSPASSSLPFEETPRGLRLRIDRSKGSVLLNREGKPIELSFPGGEVVTLQPGAGVPRRIEANGPDGRAILTLESFGPWPEGEEVPPP